MKHLVAVCLAVAISTGMSVASTAALRSQQLDTIRIRSDYRKKLKRTADPFTKTAIWALDLGTQSGNNDCPGQVAIIQLTAVRLDPDTGAFRGPTLRVAYAGDEWLFLDKRQPLSALADTTLVTFIPIGDPNRDVTGSTILEIALLRTTAADLHRVADADSVRWRLNGQRGNCGFRFDRRKLAMLGMFADDTMP